MCALLQWSQTSRFPHPHFLSSCKNSKSYVVPENGKVLSIYPSRFLLEHKPCVPTVGICAWSSFQPQPKQGTLLWQPWSLLVMQKALWLLISCHFGETNLIRGSCFSRVGLRNPDLSMFWSGRTSSYHSWFFLLSNNPILSTHPLSKTFQTKTVSNLQGKWNAALWCTELWLLFW